MKQSLDDLPGPDYAFHAQVANIGFGILLEELVALIHPLVGDEEIAAVQRRAIERLKNLSLEGAGIDLDAEIIHYAINVVEFAANQAQKRARGQ